ncbi:MAG: hypothetical protein JXR03_03970 [Cyclobacteriaceae bacterium]
MILESKNVDISINDSYLSFIFKDKFTEEASASSTKAWKEIFNSRSGKSFTLIWDCLQMTGFEPSAKNKWMECMGGLRNQISSVIVISDNIVIRGASHLMLKFYGFEYRVFKSQEEVQKLFAKSPI